MLAKFANREPKNQSRRDVFAFNLNIDTQRRTTARLEIRSSPSSPAPRLPEACTVPAPTAS